MLTMNDAFSKIEKIRLSKGYVKLALIDPDSKNDLKFEKIISRIQKSNFDGILIGGSKVEPIHYEKRIKLLNNLLNLPTLLFPGSSKHITKHIKSMLYLNLISGRNPKYLIEEHVNSSLEIYSNKINTIPTAYILLNGGVRTTVEQKSETVSLSMDNFENVLKHALAGQYLGNKLIYFDCGSGAKNIIKTDLLKYIKNHIDIPIMVGGGIKSQNDISTLIDSGASYIVCGTMFEI